MGTACGCNVASSSAERRPVPCEYEPGSSTAGLSEEADVLYKKDFEESPITAAHFEEDVDVGGVESMASTGRRRVSLSLEEAIGFNDDEGDGDAEKDKDLQKEKDLAEAVRSMHSILDREPAIEREIEGAIQNAQKAGVPDSEIEVARQRLAAIKALEKLNQAALERNPDKLNEALANAQKAKVQESALTKAREVLITIQEEERSKAIEQERTTRINAIKAGISSAIASKNLQQLKDAVKEAEQEGVPAAELQDAKKALEELQNPPKKGFFGRKK